MPKPMRGAPRKRPARSKAKRVPLDTKIKPRQLRAKETYETILVAAGNLLEEVGIERLSTNLVCKRAGITPPALYRYFPNKYALLKELGARLMEVQDEAVFEYIRQHGTQTMSLAEDAGRMTRLQGLINDITRKFPGGAWVMRAMRAVPTLGAVRIASREAVAARIYDALLERYPQAEKKDLRVAATLSVEVGYSAMELVMDEPELDAARIDAEISYMIALYQHSFADPARKSRKNGR
jgi:AcrR family transcriptional regulator